MKGMLPLEQKTTRGVVMKRLNIVIAPCITVVAIATILLRGGTGAAAAIPTQHTHNAGSCGAWSQVASPNVGTSYNVLNGVAAISTNNGWAVGAYGNGNGSSSLIEHWSKSKWAVVSSPNIAGSLAGIAAIAANNIWAVGENDSSNMQEPLVEHWNGKAWSIIYSPNLAPSGNTLAVISVVTAKDIWAVGTTTSTSSRSGYQPLIEHWNGTQWSTSSSPAISGRLFSVAAVGPNDAWAVGWVSNTNGIQTLTEHWNGSAWSVVTSSGPGLAINRLNGVAAISSQDVWAVGEDTNSSAPSAEFNPLVEHWNGSSWSVVTSPLQGTSDFLNGIAAVSSRNIWVVGDYRSGIDPMGPYFTLIEHWNGSAWTLASSPSPGSIASDLGAAPPLPAQTKVCAEGGLERTLYQTPSRLCC